MYAKCWLVFDILDTPNIGNALEVYSPLQSTFLAMYIYQDSPNANWPVTSITINTKIDNPALRVFE